MTRFFFMSMLTGCCPTKETVDIPEPCRKRTSGAAESVLQRLSISDISKQPSANLSEDISNSLAGTNLYFFTLPELRMITRNFSSTNFLGEGGFGPVHKGFIDERVRPGLTPQTVAVKILDLEGAQGHKEWLTEVIYLGQLSHPHLVNLIGCCCEDDHRVLIYEYMPRGSLENQLFRRFSGALPWSARMKIALGAAKGVAFLHEAEKPVIYRDFKASNVLLDSNFHPKLSDFGLAKDGPEGDNTHVSTRVMGTQGYAAPEYIMTGHLTAMSDVYSFGVVLLEMLTGRKSVDKTRPSREQNLVEWARPMLVDPRRVTRLVDPRLEGQYSETGARRTAELAYRCLSQRPRHRPFMSAVVRTLEELQDFHDVPVEPFVYTVQPARGTPCEPDENRTDPAKESRRRRDRGHRLRAPTSPAVYSETVVREKMANGGGTADLPPEK